MRKRKVLTIYVSDQIQRSIRMAAAMNEESISKFIKDALMERLQTMNLLPKEEKINESKKNQKKRFIIYVSEEEKEITHEAAKISGQLDATFVRTAVNKKLQSLGYPV